MSEVRPYKNYTIQEFLTWLLPPLDESQVAFFYRGEQLEAMVTWAKLSDSDHTKMLDKLGGYEEICWNGGSHVWVIDLVKTEAMSVKPIISFFRNSPEFDKIFFSRRDKSAEAKKVTSVSRDGRVVSNRVNQS